MDAKTATMLAEFHNDLVTLGPKMLLAVIDILALAEVEGFIAQNPLPVDADPDEMRSIMLIITITQAVKRAGRLLNEADAARRPANTPPSPQEETAAKDAADAAIAKAQGKPN